MTQNKTPLRIGLTGSIAAGKSTVGRYLQEQGVAFWDADQAARDVVRKGQPALAKIGETFGAQMLTADGELNRKALGAVVFGDGEKLRQLNAITHPAIFEDMNAAIKKACETGEAMIVLDIPLLYETGGEKDVDLVCLVYCEDEIRLRRLMERDGLARAEALARMGSQLPQEQKGALADVVIDNSDGRAHALQQTESALQTWRALAQQRREE